MFKVTYNLFLKNKFKYIILATILTSISAFLTSSFIYLLKIFINKVFLEKNYEYLYISPLLILMLSLFVGFLNILSYYFFNKISFSILLEIREKLIEKILKLNFLNFYKNKTGFYLNVLVQDVNNLQQFLTNNIPLLVRNIFLALFLIISTFVINFKFALISYLTFPILIISVNFVNKKIKKYYKKIQNINDEILNLTSLIVNNLKEIKNLNLEYKFIEKYKEENKKLMEIFLKNKLFEVLSPNLSQTLFFLMVGFLFFLGGKYIISNELSVGGFVAFLTALVLVLDPIKKITKSVGEIQQNLISLTRILNVLKEDEERTFGEILNNIEKIKLENVSLNLNQKNILKNINLSFEKSKKYGIVGPSGSGKSSLINLLLGLLVPTSGNIYFNDIEISKINLRSLRDRISVVSQDIVLFPGTIFENLKIVKPTASFEEIKEACKKAQILDFIEKLPQKFNTKIGPGGINLSGGQKQRLAIARAILKDSDVLILDEATSALDLKTEKEITKIIDSLAKNKILIVIAHRLNTILNSDEIIVLKNGEIEYKGPLTKVLNSSRTFQELYKNLTLSS
ncbi:MAG TPA: ABC transporter ATP-binding protein [Desulfurobacteriaceae bacterium]|nr:ABC transporter ATP-binding protein [Desulfurobacteriaceae bacterium]